MLDRIRVLNESYNTEVERVFRSAPWWLHAMACLGWPRRLYNWQCRQQIWTDKR